MTATAAPVLPTPVSTRTSRRRTCTLLNELGDVTLEWGEDEDTQMLPVIQGLIDKGVTFFMLKPGIIRTRRTKLKTLDDLKGRKLEFTNDHFEKVFFNGAVELRRSDSGRIETAKTIKTAEEVMTSHTVATRQLKGG